MSNENYLTGEFLSRLMHDEFLSFEEKVCLVVYIGAALDQIKHFISPTYLKNQSIAECLKLIEKRIRRDHLLALERGVNQ